MWRISFIVGFILLFMNACSESDARSQIFTVEEKVITENRQKNKADKLKSEAIKDDYQVGNSFGLDSLIFGEACYAKINNVFNSTDKSIFQDYFFSSDLKSIEVSSFCKDSIYNNMNKCIDYLNGRYRVLRFNYIDSISTLNCFLNFCQDFRNIEINKAQYFWCLKPGFITFIEGNEISFIFIDDCSERNKFNNIKEVVKLNFLPTNYLISRCGLNIEM